MTTAPQQPQWLTALAQRKQEVAYVLLALAVVLGGVAGYFMYKSGWDQAPAILLCAWAALVLLGLGLWRLLDEGTALDPVEGSRLAVLLLGGLIGLDLYVVAIYLIYRWWSTVTGGLEEWQGENGWQIWVIILAGISALILTFGSMLVARSEEQSNPLMRRLFYGYNAVLTGQLVLLILVVLNILGYIFLPKESDWTKSRIYTLSSQSQNILKGLEKPVKVYMILDSLRDPAYDDLTKLLNNCRAITNKIDWELVLRGRQDTRVRELMRRYLLVDPVGMLVVSGTEPKEDSQFVKRDDLYESPPFDPMRRSRRREEPTFKGEDALMTAIKYLDEGKTKPVIYFLQGHGEYDVSSGIGAGRARQRADDLRNQLEKANHQVKALSLSKAAAAKEGDSNFVVAEQVPDDAAVVVILGPRTPLERETLEALRLYMNPKEASKKKGKLLVLLDVVTTPDNQMQKTGLEAFLQEFNVDVGNDRVLSPVEANPDLVIAMSNAQPGDRNTLATGLGDEQWYFFNVRSVRGRNNPAPRPGAAGNYQADTLLTTVGRPVWPETNLDDPLKIIEALKKDPAVRKSVQSKLSASVPVAVTVSESTGGPAPGDPHGGMFGGESKPRMVVFGNAAWASNEPIPGRQLSQQDSRYYSLFASSLAWLRERPSNIGIEAKKRDTYQMNESTNVGRMLLLPAGLMFVCILGVGLGVWVVRRR
jgi:hypothetical protein